MRMIAIIMGLGLVLAGCGSSMDWTALAVDAVPEFKPGGCGPELRWVKTIAVHSTAEIEGVLIVRPRCKDDQPTKD